MEVLNQPSLSVKVYNFLLSNSVACLRDVYEALSEKPCRVDDCLRRLWIKGLILRTREPNFEFDTCHRGRAGCVGYNRANNYYVVNDGQEIGSQFVGYEDRKKDGRSRDIESKACSNLRKSWRVDCTRELIF